MSLALEIPTDCLTLATLLRLNTRIRQELQKRRILRTGSGIIGDLAEHLFCEAFPTWQQVPSGSHKGYDATEKTENGEHHYQIKARRASNHFEISHLTEKPFDTLAVLIFKKGQDGAEDYMVDYAALIPWEVVCAHATPQPKRGNHYLLLTKDVCKADGVKKVTKNIEQAFNSNQNITGRRN